MRRAATLLLALALAVATLETTGLLGLRIVEGRWVLPGNLRQERRSFIAAQPEEGGPTVEPGAAPHLLPWPASGRRTVLHPFVGFVQEASASPEEDEGDPLRRLGFPSDSSPIPHPAGPGDFVVLVFGGSVAAGFEELGGAAPLVERLRGLPDAAGKRIHVGTVAIGGFKQPQQLLALAYLLALGLHVDAVVNLDGFNEATLGPTENVPRGVASFFPRQWGLRVQDTPDRRRQAMMGEIAYLRERRAGWGRAFEHVALRRSAAATLAWRLRDARHAARLAVLERAFVQEAADPESWLVAPPHPRERGRGIEGLVEELVAVWRDSSMQMSRLAGASGARYFHFLQPNQYVAGSKPMGEAELRRAVVRRSPSERWVARVYPGLLAAGSELHSAGVAFFDTTQVFREVEEPLYTDNCCHFSPQGYEILGQAMAEAMAQEW